MFFPDSSEDAWSREQHIQNHSSFFRIADIVTRKMDIFQIRKFLLQELSRSPFTGQNDISPSCLQFPDKRNTAGGVAEAPVERCDENAFQAVIVFIRRYERMMSSIVEI